ncbi:MAG: hypothetical protein ACMXX9_04185 [Candidatus Woesearchaeota archaeon]
MKITNLENKEIELKQITDKLKNFDESGLNQSEALVLNKETDSGKIYLPVRIFAEDNEKTYGYKDVDISVYSVIDPIFFKTGEILELTDVLNINNTSSSDADLYESSFSIRIYDTVNKIKQEDLQNLVMTQLDLFETQHYIINQAYNKITRGGDLNNYKAENLSSDDFFKLSKNLRNYVDTGSSRKDWKDVWKGKSFTLLADFAKLSDAIFLHENKIYSDAPSPARELFDTKIAVLNGMYKKE